MLTLSAAILKLDHSLPGGKRGNLSGGALAAIDMHEVNECLAQQVFYAPSVACRSRRIEAFEIAAIESRSTHQVEGLAEELDEVLLVHTCR